MTDPTKNKPSQTLKVERKLTEREEFPFAIVNFTRGEVTRQVPVRRVWIQKTYSNCVSVLNIPHPSDWESYLKSEVKKPSTIGKGWSRIYVFNVLDKFKTYEELIAKAPIPYENEMTPKNSSTVNPLNETNPDEIAVTEFLERSIEIVNENDSLSYEDYLLEEFDKNKPSTSASLSVPFLSQSDSSNDVIGQPSKKQKLCFTPLSNEADLQKCVAKLLATKDNGYLEWIEAVKNEFKLTEIEKFSPNHVITKFRSFLRVFFNRDILLKYTFSSIPEPIMHFIAVAFSTANEELCHSVAILLKSLRTAWAELRNLAIRKGTIPKNKRNPKTNKENPVDDTTVDAETLIVQENTDQI